MGLVYRHVPEKHAKHLAQKYGLTTFIETGTLMGKSAVWASHHFQRVVTIEADGGYYIKAIAKNHSLLLKIEFILGLSQEILPGIIQSLREPALFWLDAHWSRDLTYGKPEIICPVLMELEIINESKLNHAIMVDDARLFGDPGWPSTKSVIESLKQNGSRAITMRDDVFIAEPLKETI